MKVDVIGVARRPDLAEQPRLPTGQVIAYGSGDLAFNLYFTFCSLFLLYFYTDVLGLSASVAGLIIMAALVWEGITDPAMGVIASRTRSRFGSYRPYLLFGAPILAIAFIAMFLPLGLSGYALAAFCLTTHILFRTVYTVVNIPFVALSARMSADSLARSRLAGARMLFAILTGLFLAAATLPLVARLGGGREGFLWVAALYAAIATLVLLNCFRKTREAIGEAPGAHPTLGAMLRAVRSNRVFLLLLGATLIGSVGYAMGGKALLYYMKYYAGSEETITIGLTISLASAALSMLLWVKLTQRIGKRAVWLSGIAISATANILIFALGPKAGGLLYGLLAVSGVGNAAFVLTFWSMLPDTVEVGEWQTGLRAEGALVGFLAFTQKVALGVGTGLIGILLDVIGYVPNVPQTPEALTSIRGLATIVPAMLAIGAGLFIYFYPLDTRTHARLVRAIGWRNTRRNRAASPTTNMDK
ncbi:MFS transporter [Sphingopyxis sp.]|uniref:MFS transporter n=1 Tax=Sphingopyxis sp. TaxID=1908224 RepID=UPI0010F6709A|nr:glycoside-pentoside-hexuronide (GPH):cation symporter [Sphingopyxis sp.]MBR2173530.1 MFS transporter [Sphingopyxis sp.]